MRPMILHEASLRRQAIEYRRYGFETLTMVLTLYGFFVVLFVGARAVGGGGPGFGDTVAGLVVAFALWTLALYGYFSIAQGVTQEAQLGTLEQLAMSRFGLVRVLGAQVTTGLVFQLVIMAMLLVLMMATTGQWLNLDVLSILPLLLLTIAGIIGLGFLMGGLAVVFKRVQAALNIMQVGLLGLVAAPADTFPLLKYLPLAWGATLIRRVMVDGVSIVQIPVSSLAFLVVNSFAYLALGVWVFRLLERKARDRALLGHY